MSLRRYFKPANKLPTADKAGLSANVVREVNQVVTRTLERSEASAGKKRKYTTTFTPEDRAAIARYAAQNGNSAAVKGRGSYRDPPSDGKRKNLIRNWLQNHETQTLNCAIKTGPTVCSSLHLCATLQCASAPKQRWRMRRTIFARRGPQLLAKLVRVGPILLSNLVPPDRF